MLELVPPLPDQFNRLFKPLEHNLSSVSIKMGLTRSKVYTDSMEPSWIVTYSNSRVLVSGDLKHAGVVEAVQRIVDQGIQNGRRGFVIYYPGGTEKTGIGEDIQGVDSYPNIRNYYTLMLAKTGYPIQLPEDYSIMQITESVLSKGYQNTDLVMNEMRSERASIEDFLEKGFGFCVLHGDKIAAWCMSEYNAVNRFEIGIETHLDHRRKGLALQTARACMNHGISNGYTQVGWHCWVKNIESNNLAKRLGFKHVLQYPVEYLEVKEK